MTVWKSTHLQGLLLLFIIGLMFLPIPVSNLWWREAFNTGHTFVFMAFAYLLAKHLSAQKIFPDMFLVYLGGLVVVMLTGIAIELAQGFVNREMSWGDLQNDLLGALAGFAFFHAGRSGRHGTRHEPVLTGLLASVLILFGSFSLMQLSWHYVQREQAFPVIADFGAPWSESFVRYNRVKLLSDVRDTRGMYGFEFSPGTYPGINIIEPETDWSHYRRLRFRIFSSYKEKIIFVLRIHDRWHNQGYADRFNKRLTISPGMNDITLDMEKIKKGPVKRQLDIENIAGMTLFLMKLEERNIFEISELYLE